MTQPFADVADDARVSERPLVDKGFASVRKIGNGCTRRFPICRGRWIRTIISTTRQGMSLRHQGHRGMGAPGSGEANCG